MRPITSFLVSAVLITTSVPVLAQTQDPGVDRRQETQQQSIERGVESGQLTQGEAARLEEEQKRVADLEERLKSDGTLTPRERARLQHRLDESRRHIERLKHNRRTR